MIPKNVDLVNQARSLSYPTPFFFTSKSLLKHNYKSFKNLLDNVDVYYAVKANSDSKILKYLSSLGSGFEAASFFEIKELLQLDVPAKKIIYGTAVKPAAHIRKAAKSGVDRFAVDSKEEIEKIAKEAPGSRVFIRVKVDDTGSVFTFSERFGAPIEDIKNLVHSAIDSGLKIYGLSFHVGSQATNEHRWSNAINSLRPIIEELHEEGIKLDIINLGGGFPVSYYNHQHVPHLPEIVAHIRNTLHMLPDRIPLWSLRLYQKQFEGEKFGYV
jgi:ornithine decarboxylase